MMCLIATLSVVAAILAPEGALAAKAPHRYSPKHGAKCRKHYRRVRHGKKVYCVKKAMPKKTPPTGPLKKVKLHSHLDPSFTRNPLDPFQVTYAFSASATQELVPQTGAAVASASAVEEPAPLPSGVLALYSDGRLECAVEVGGALTGSECPVNYSALGQHTVTTIYSSGEQSATETEVEDIGPLASSTSLALSYQDAEGGPVPLREEGHCEVFGGIEDRCHYDYEWQLGELTATGGAAPTGSTSLACLEGSACKGTFGGKSLDGSLSEPVVLTVKIFIRHSGPEHPDCQELKAIYEGGATAEAEWSYPTSLGLRAISSAPGYTTSEAADAIDFTPTLPC